MSENENSAVKKGGISVDTEHLFPIIKKWLYSEKDIFLREIVSNATDAITKLRRLSSLGEVRGLNDDFRVTVTVSRSARTLTVEDNGIGMTAEEVEKYIGSIALSGALDFIQKYEGENGASNGIIGHFGLGFYSAFMVSDSVDIESKSYTGAAAVRWCCGESGEYEMFDSDREERGTLVTMHIADGEDEYLEASRIREMLGKYCSFMPEEIYFTDADAPAPEHKHDHEDGCDCGECSHEEQTDKPVNDTTPLWNKPASECTDEEYREFYRKVFNDYREPLFQIHLNADYPLNFKGILYFPKLAHEYDSLEGQVKLYYNQVFVADNIKEVIPEYMLMLKGVLDCPELPLNVSRSYLQTNTYVSKLSAHIVKKVADKLGALCNNERERYNKLWGDIKTFVEYACIRDRKFYDRVRPGILVPLTDGSCVTLDEYLEAAKEKHEGIVYYTNDKNAQAQYISMFEAEGIQIALYDKLLDTQFMTTVEGAEADRKVKFVRIDADIASILRGEGDAAELGEVGGLFVKLSGNEKLTVKYENLKNADIPLVLNISEQSRRFGDMMKLYAMSSGEDAGAAFPEEMTLAVNTASPLVQKLDRMLKDDPAAAERLGGQMWNLALLSQRQLSAQELKKFLADSYAVLRDGI